MSRQEARQPVIFVGRLANGLDSMFKPEEGVYLLLDPHTNAKSPCVTTRVHSYANTITKITVPKGFRCDFASVPFFALWFFGAFDRHQRASMFHDVMYRQQTGTRFQADAMYRTLLHADGVGFFRRLLLYSAVRAFGWKAWRNNKINTFDFRSSLDEQDKG